MEDLKEKCGVFGVYGKGMDAARLTYFGLYSLQHRGQESAGITVSDGTKLNTHKDMGLVAQVFSEEVITSLKGHVAIGHNRYSTAGGSKVRHAQPIVSPDGAFALGHNGNLPSTKALWDYLRACGDVADGSDSSLIVDAMYAAMKKGATLEGAIREVYPFLTGAFSILIISKDKLIAIRDHCGIRPLSLAKLNGGYILSSETCALHPIGAEYIREIEPGEMLVIDESGLHSEQLAVPNPKFDMFEFVYFARPDSDLMGRSVYEVRKSFGKELAREKKIEADVVIPVPETAVPVAIGYSQASGIPFELGLAKNRYIHRTFIQPEQHLREQGVKMKLTPTKDTIAGKRVIVVDDSIVRGTTSRQIVKMHLFCARLKKHFDYLARGRATYNRIVDNNHPLPCYRLAGRG